MYAEVWTYLQAKIDKLLDIIINTSSKVFTTVTTGISQLVYDLLNVANIAIQDISDHAEQMVQAGVALVSVSVGIDIARSSLTTLSTGISSALGTIRAAFNSMKITVPTLTVDSPNIDVLLSDLMLVQTTLKQNTTKFLDSLEDTEVQVPELEELSEEPVNEMLSKISDRSGAAEFIARQILEPSVLDKLEFVTTYMPIFIALIIIYGALKIAR